ncbi:acyl-CoA N-acyltransferase [Striga asiatica]|uniref:Acyl-CoA N-acyltransferase n=1 Tax=Striga asiatica TaxID=4170 RepID=A0A5A7QLF1_STRAF|nr:acyl-CoA N-acyltransferase [Striga asiatica]
MVARLAGIAYSLCLTVLGSFSSVPTCFLVAACVWHSMEDGLGYLLAVRDDGLVYLTSEDSSVSGDPCASSLLCGAFGPHPCSSTSSCWYLARWNFWPGQASVPVSLSGSGYLRKIPSLHRKKIVKSFPWDCYLGDTKTATKGSASAYLYSYSVTSLSYGLRLSFVTLLVSQQNKQGP